MLKIAICEDNSIHCKQIHDLTCSCLQAAYDVDIYTSADDFLARITDQKCPYQIVLMDIELDSGDMSGIHLAEKINLSNSETQIIFISQYLQYASAVYETNHVYFVSKQQMEEYLPRALSAACRKLSELHRQYFCFNYLSRDYRIPRSDILYMERKLRNTEIHTKSQIYYCRDKIQDLIEQLQPDFCICHKSFAVNINAIHTLSHAGIEISDGTRLPVSRNCYQSTKDAFAQLLLKSQNEDL